MMEDSEKFNHEHAYIINISILVHFYGYVFRFHAIDIFRNWFILPWNKVTQKSNAEVIDPKVENHPYAHRLHTFFLSNDMVTI